VRRRAGGGSSAYLSLLLRPCPSSGRVGLPHGTCWSSLALSGHSLLYVNTNRLVPLPSNRDRVDTIFSFFSIIFIFYLFFKIFLNGPRCPLWGLVDEYFAPPSPALSTNPLASALATSTADNLLHLLQQQYALSPQLPAPPVSAPPAAWSPRFRHDLPHAFALCDLRFSLGFSFFALLAAGFSDGSCFNEGIWWVVAGFLSLRSVSWGRWR
jgi:hypothetical protein